MSIPEGGTASVVEEVAPKEVIQLTYCEVERAAPQIPRCEYPQLLHGNREGGVRDYSGENIGTPLGVALPKRRISLAGNQVLPRVVLAGQVDVHVSKEQLAGDTREDVWDEEQSPQLVTR